MPLINASDECCFWMTDGHILRNLKHLAQALKESTDEAFKYHVNAEKNDFAKWVDEVLRDQKLAKEIQKIKTRQAMLKRVEKRLKDYA